MRTRAERRKNNWKKAKRQIEIEKNAEGTLGNGHQPLLKFVHAYSKNKVPYARPWMKTKVEPDIADQRKIDEINDQLDENKSG